jgi:hypothetical protein
MKQPRKKWQAVGFVLATVVVFAVLAGIFYGLFQMVFQLPIFQNTPSKVVGWLIILVVPAVLTTQFMRLVYYALQSESDRW